MGIEESQECAGESGGLFAEGRDLLIAWLGAFVSEAFESRKLNETRCKCPMVTIRMVAQCEWQAGGRVA